MSDACANLDLAKVYSLTMKICLATYSSTDYNSVDVTITQQQPMNGVGNHNKYNIQFVWSSTYSIFF